MKRRLAGLLAAGLALGAGVAVLWTLRAGTLEAERLLGQELLGNLQGYLKVNRVEEAAQVLAALDGGGGQAEFLDQARYEVARAYVAAGKGELAIELLDRISLHDRSFPFQRAILREKVRGLHGFFFDPSGDLRTPAQLEDFVFHSAKNPDKELQTRNPKGFEDPNKLLDYFNAVTHQLEDVMAIEGLPRQAEPVLAEGYDAIQILLFGRGLLLREELAARLASSATGTSPRTRYLLGNQFFMEAEYESAFESWGTLLQEAPESKEALRAFAKTWALFEARRLLDKAFAFWPLQEPPWLRRLEAQAPFAQAASEERKRLSGHQDLAKYAAATEASLAASAIRPARTLVATETQAPAAIAPEILEKAELGDHFEGLPVPSDLTDSTAIPLILERAPNMGWRLQTEFREFLLGRDTGRIFTPGEPKAVLVRSSYHGQVRLQARAFPDGDAYRRFQLLPAKAAVQAAAGLPLVKEWTDSLGQLADNGKQIRQELKVPLAEPGFYLIVARVRYAPVVAVTQLAVVAEKVLTWSSPEGVLFRVVDRLSGQPIAKARLRGQITPCYEMAQVAPRFFDGSRSESFRNGFTTAFHGGPGEGPATGPDDYLNGFREGLQAREKFPLTPDGFELRSSEDGTASLEVPVKWRGVPCAVRATLNELGALCPVEVLCARPERIRSWQALFYAERPIFQPGEKVRLKGLLRRVDVTGLSLPEEEAEVEILLWHANRLYGAFRVKPNAIGTVVFEAALPEDAALGSYHLTIGHQGQRYPVFRVDRGERAILELAVRPEAEVLFAGSTLRGTVNVSRAGFVAAGVPVAVKVYRGPALEPPRPSDPREEFFAAVVWKEYPERGEGELLSERLAQMKEVWREQGVTDAKGEFPFAFDSDPRAAARYVVLAEARAIPQREEAAYAEIRTHNLPFFLEVAPERHSYYPGETLRAQVFTRALNGKPQAASLRLEVGAETGQGGGRAEYAETIKTDSAGRALLAVPLGRVQVPIRVGVQGAKGWSFREVPYQLNQIAASSGKGGLSLQLDKTAYYPGETARITIQSTRPGADLLLTLSREKVRLHQRMVIQGTTGFFSVPLDESATPNLFFQAVQVADDTAYSQTIEIPVIPIQRILKVEIETDREEYAGGGPVAALVKVTDWKGEAVAGAEVSLAAVLSSAFALQEDLTPDLARYFLNHRLPLWVSLGGSELASDRPRQENFWLAAAFAWGIYRDQAGLESESGEGLFGSGGGAGRRLMVTRHGGSRASQLHAAAYAEFLRQHGLTLFHEARLVTDRAGQARVQFLLPASSGEFRFTARALTAGTCVGEVRRTVKFRLDVTLQASWPASIREGERFQSPLFLVNQTARAQQGLVEISSDLPTRLLGPAEVSLTPGGVARLDFELDARQVPPVLADPQSGYQAPLTFARFSASFKSPEGPRTINQALVPLLRRGAPIERRVVSLVSAGRRAKEIRIDCALALPNSVHLRIRPLSDPKTVLRWLVEDLRLREGGDHYAWAAEGLAERLGPREIEAGGSLPIEPPLLASLSKGVDSHFGGREPFLLAVSSARRRGVRVPGSWEDGIAKQVAGPGVDQLTPLGAWVAAECLSNPEVQGPLAAYLERIPEAGQRSREEWAFLALAMQRLDRKSKAAGCLERALAGVLNQRRERLGELPLQEAAVLLLAGTRAGLELESLGQLYEALLDALARSPRPEPFAAALAAQGIVSWSRFWQPSDEAQKITVNGKEWVLEKSAVLELYPEAGKDLSITIPAPRTGAVAAEISCTFRLPERAAEQRSDNTISRRFLRLDREGAGHELQSGEALRLGETLLMVLNAQGSRPLLATVPHAGPWAGEALRRCPRPAVRVLREFVLSGERRDNVLAAAAEKRFSAVREELLAGLEAGDFLVDTEGGGEEELAAAPTPLVDSRMACLRFQFNGNQPLALAYRPDRVGDFQAPAAWLQGAEDGTPTACAPSFALRVVEADAVLAERPLVREARDNLGVRVAIALALAPEAVLEGYLKGCNTLLDTRVLALAGALCASGPQAAQAYAGLCWPEQGPDLLTRLQRSSEWREKIRPGALLLGPAFGVEVLRRALEGEELSSHLAKALEEGLSGERGLGRKSGALGKAGDPDPTVGAELGRVERVLEAEAGWREGLVEAARGSPEMEGIGLRRLSLTDVLRRVSPAGLEQILRALEREGVADRGSVSGPSLCRALQDWGAEFTLEVVCDRDVPDLGMEEFRLRLPGMPSVRALDENLHPFFLRARREGRVVRISTDRDWARFRPAVKALWEARDAAGRLELFLSGSKVDGAGLAALVKSWFQPDLGAEGYHPRVEVEAELGGIDQLAKLPLDPHRPLSQQLLGLRAFGYLLEARDGILRIGRVPGRRPVTKDERQVTSDK